MKVDATILARSEKTMHMWPPTAHLMFVHFVSGVLSLEMRGEIGPDPMKWSVADVVSYFTTAGFPEQAVAFRAQVLCIPMFFPCSPH